MKKTNKKYFIILPLALICAVVFLSYLFPGTTFRILASVERGIAGIGQKGVEVQGLHMEYLEGGEGEAILLLHGFGGNKDNWTRIARHLTPHFRVIAPDLPGFGQSTREPGSDYTISAQADRIRAFARALNIDRFHLAGNSMGGTIAGACAARYSNDIISLWLIAPGGIMSAEPSELFRLLKGGKANPLIAESPEEYEDLLDFVCVKRPFIPSVIRDFLAEEAVRNSPLNKEIFKQIRKSMETSPLEVLLKGLRVPTLILWGAGDRVLHVSGARILESVIPGAKISIMEETGHVPMIERPEESARIFLDFLNIGK